MFFFTLFTLKIKYFNNNFFIFNANSNHKNFMHDVGQLLIFYGLLFFRRTSFKQLVICAQFPEDYPKSPLLLELKSKTISVKLLEKLATVCEQEAKKYLGKPQVVNFLLSFLNIILIMFY